MTFTADVTTCLRNLREGDPGALDRVIERLYGELRAIARNRLRRELRDRPFATTELVHEAYLRLLGDEGLRAEDRRDFFAAASNTMRRILVEAARSRDRLKRGGAFDGDRFVDAAELEHLLTDEQARETLDLDRALDKLKTLAPRAAEVVQHRYFAGLSLEESAAALGVSTKTVRRDWLTARAWIRRELGESHG